MFFYTQIQTFYNLHLPVHKSHFLASLSAWYFYFTSSAFHTICFYVFITCTSFAGTCIHDTSRGSKLIAFHTYLSDTSGPKRYFRLSHIEFNISRSCFSTFLASFSLLLQAEWLWPIWARVRYNCFTPAQPYFSVLFVIKMEVI